MLAVREKAAVTVLLAVGLSALVPEAKAQDPNDPLTIRETQYTVDPNGASPYDGYVVDCLGGVCVAKWAGFGWPRLILQDGSDPNGWCGIQVKDLSTSNELYDGVVVGDWVSFTNMLVWEKSGTTFLYWDPNNIPQYAISPDNPLPPPLIVPVSEIPAPICDPNSGECLVENHDAEKYESVRLLVRDVTVTEKGLGKVPDNYILSTDPNDPEAPGCWAADYMNEECEEDDYHRFVSVGQHFCGVSGVFEQYTNLYSGWDYYQLVTMTSADLAICGDTDHDGDVDLSDLAQLLGHYGTTSGATYEDGDFDYDGDVDLSDLAELLGNYGTSVP